MNPIIPIEKAGIFFDGVFTEPRLSHPEGLAFDKEGNLWCGGENGEIYMIDREGKNIKLVACTGGFSLGMAIDQHNNLYVCDNKHSAVFKLNIDTEELSLFATGGLGEKIRVPNFPVVDEKRSCLYVSDSFGFNQIGPGIWKFDLETGKGSLWYKEQMNFANGMVLSLDGNSLFVAETFDRAVSRIPILENGEPGEKQHVATIDGLPDGLGMDKKGNLYVCCYEPSRLYRINSNNEVELLISDPTAHTLCHPTNCAFRGEDLFTSNLGRWHITRFRVGEEGL